MHSPHLILTTIHRLPATACAPFFLSLRLCNYSGSVVVLASEIDNETLAQLKKWGAQIEPFTFTGKHVANRLARLWPIWRRVFASPIPQALKYRLAHRVFHLFYRRHLLYLEFLQSFGRDFQRVLLTDCRDVFFQTDPFAWNQARGLHVFLEEESMLVDQDTHHIRWIKSQFGAGVLDDLKGRTISCAGTIFGDPPSLEAYARQMVSLTMVANSLSATDGDQGLHNFLVHSAPLPGMTIHSNRSGPVMTVGTMKVEDLVFDNEGWVRNEVNERPAVLHQYDRISELRTALHNRIGISD